MTNTDRIRRHIPGLVPDGVELRSGTASRAPHVVFADVDYEIGDGICGLHERARSANEPAIPYVRIDWLITEKERVERLLRRIEELERELDDTSREAAPPLTATEQNIRQREQDRQDAERWRFVVRNPFRACDLLKTSPINQTKWHIEVPRLFDEAMRREEGPASPALTAERVRAAMLSSGCSFFPIRDCSLCGVDIGYIILEKDLFFQSSCGCGSSAPDRREWQEIANLINMQAFPEGRKKLMQLFNLEPNE